MDDHDVGGRWLMVKGSVGRASMAVMSVVEGGHEVGGSVVEGRWVECEWSRRRRVDSQEVRGQNWCVEGAVGRAGGKWAGRG